MANDNHFVVRRCKGAFVFLFLSFVLGISGGLVLSMINGYDDPVASYLKDYVEFASDGPISVSILSILFDCFQWPLLVFLLGFTAAGFVLIPLTFVLRGFLLSYAVSSFALVFGYSGICLAAVIFIVEIILIVPCTFFLGFDAFRRAYYRLPGPSNGTYKHAACEVALLAVGILLVSSAVQWIAVPKLFSIISARGGYLI